MSDVVQEIACPPDQLEVDVVAAILFDGRDMLDGPAGLLNRRLGCGLLFSPDQSVLVRSNHKVAARWVLFHGWAAGCPERDSDLRELLAELLRVCRRAGFERIALAAPEAALAKREQWTPALAQTASEAGVSECLVTYDHSYLHDHSGPVF